MLNGVDRSGLRPPVTLGSKVFLATIVSPRLVLVPPKMYCPPNFKSLLPPAHCGTNHEYASLISYALSMRKSAPLFGPSKNVSMLSVGCRLTIGTPSCTSGTVKPFFSWV